MKKTSPIWGCFFSIASIKTIMSLLIKISKNHLISHLSILAIVFFNILPIGAQQSNKSRSLSFSIDPSSELSISGTSNVTDFTCKCEDRFENYTYNLYASKDDLKFFLYNTYIRLNTKSFNCKNYSISKDMWKALQADAHPQISIELLQVLQNKNNELANACNQWITLNAILKITIAGNSKVVNLDVKVRELDKNKFRFVSSCNLLMTEFKITPPTALFEMVKVHDAITIDFDLLIYVQDA